MRPTRALPVAAILAAGACGLFPREPTLEITVDYGGGTQPWPPGQDTATVRIRSGLDDPKGLAGLEIILAGALPDRVFTAADFVGAGDTPSQFGIPDVGTAIVTARLVQDGRVVAEGTREWTLESEVEWDLRVTRAGWPAGEIGPMNLENPRCNWFWCHRTWRFPVVEEAANYEYEALWVTLYRVHPDECADLC